MIGKETADEGVALLSSAIAELSEDVSADAVRMERNGTTVWVLRAARLEAAGVDMAALARAIEVLGRRGEPASD